MKHEQKVRPALFCRIEDGSKNFLLAENDTGFQMGDTVLLKEWDDQPLNATADSERGPTGKQLEFKVGYVLSLSGSKVIFSLLPLKQKSK